MKIIEVFWVDSWSTSGTYDTEDISEEPLETHTVGYLAKETDTVLVLAQECYPADGRWRHLQAIEKGAIRKRKVLSR